MNVDLAVPMTAHLWHHVPMYQAPIAVFAMMDMKELALSV